MTSLRKWLKFRAEIESYSDAGDSVNADDDTIAATVDEDIESEADTSIDIEDENEEEEYESDSSNNFLQDLLTETMEPEIAFEEEGDTDNEEFSDDESLDVETLNDGSSYAILDHELFAPLYPGSTITICGAILAIMTLKEFRLPFSTISRLLILLKLLCPTGSKLPSSVHMLRKFFHAYQGKTVKKYYCSACKMELTQQNRSCNNCTSYSGNDTFIQLDMEKQFKTTLTRKSCVHIDHHF